MGEVHRVTVSDLLLTTVDEPGGVDEFGVEWRCTANDGWAGSPGSTLALVQKTRAPGAWLSPRELTPRSLGPAGFLNAPDRATARAAIDRLNAAVSVKTPVRYEVAEDDDLTRWCDVLRQDVVLAEYVTDTLVQWSAQAVAKDPRKFSDDLTTSTGLPSSVGGYTFPMSFPFTIAATTVTGRCSLTNPGNITGPVRLRIDGPIVGPEVTHVSTGLALVFESSLALGAGEWIDVDMEAQTVLANGTASRNTTVVRREWFGFDEGVNEFAFSAVSGSGLLTVTATPAWQ